MKEADIHPHHRCGENLSKFRYLQEYLVLVQGPEEEDIFGKLIYPNAKAVPAF